jgi:hypothetical protein
LRIEVYSHSTVVQASCHHAYLFYAQVESIVDFDPKKLPVASGAQTLLYQAQQHYYASSNHLSVDQSRVASLGAKNAVYA